MDSSQTIHILRSVNSLTIWNFIDQSDCLLFHLNCLTISIQFNLPAKKKHQPHRLTESYLRRQINTRHHHNIEHNCRMIGTFLVVIRNWVFFFSHSFLPILSWYSSAVLPLDWLFFFYCCCCCCLQCFALIFLDCAKCCRVYFFFRSVLFFSCPMAAYNKILSQIVSGKGKTHSCN